jgi:hypothetical protein
MELECERFLLHFYYGYVELEDLAVTHGSEKITRSTDDRQAVPLFLVSKEIAGGKAEVAEEFFNAVVTVSKIGCEIDDSIGVCIPESYRD